MQHLAEMSSPSPRRHRSHTPELLGIGSHTDNTNDYASVAPVSTRRNEIEPEIVENFVGLPEASTPGLDIVDEEIRERSENVVKLPPIDMKRSMLLSPDLITPSARQ